MNPVDSAAFGRLAGELPALADGDDRVSLGLRAETSEFLRLNGARVRQSTRVSQAQATLALVRGRKRASLLLGLTGDDAHDRALVRAGHTRLAGVVPLLPDDPHLRLPDTVQPTERDDGDAAFPPVAEVADSIARAAGGEDLVGFYAAGPMIAAHADSRGQLNWHRVASLHLDFSLVGRDHQGGARAVKSTVAGRDWSDDLLRQRIGQARERLALLQRPAQAIAPGEFRAWLAPMAVAELLAGMAWSGFSRKERATGTSSMGALGRPGTRLSPAFTLTENLADGIAPVFTASGHVRPPTVPLVVAGAGGQCLVSPRSAAEFGDAANADADEHPQALQMQAGSLPDEDVLAAIDDGLWIGNLWYLNYSDRQAARMTGMTRFACFRVRKGQITGPIDSMRFDDTLLQLFGDKLAAVGSRVEFLPSGDTWGARALSSVSCPGMLVDGLRFTL
ncbi:MAG: metallopeptidase TldD-related protein [Burkholderiaceae bacterium]